MTLGATQLLASHQRRVVFGGPGSIEKFCITLSGKRSSLTVSDFRRDSALRHARSRTHLQHVLYRLESSLRESPHDLSTRHAGTHRRSIEHPRLAYTGRREQSLRVACSCIRQSSVRLRPVCQFLRAPHVPFQLREFHPFPALHPGAPNADCLAAEWLGPYPLHPLLFRPHLQNVSAVLTQGPPGGTTVGRLVQQHSRLGTWRRDSAPRKP